MPSFGSTLPSSVLLQRREAVASFRSDPSIRVALLSITAAAVGLDFSAASAVVFVELPHEVCSCTKTSYMCMLWWSCVTLKPNTH